jgi:pilus assembly protein CpaB
LRRAVSWHRRKLAVAAAVAAVLTGVSAALPPDPPSTEVVRTRAQLGGGAPLTADDLQLVRLPREFVPDGALTSVPDAVGRVLAAPVARDQVLTELSVVAPDRAVRRDRVVAPLRLADADVAALLRVGETVDVVAAVPEAARAAVVARNVRVIGLPLPPSSSGIGGDDNQGAGALVLVEVDGSTAAALAQAAVTGTLSVILR